MESRLTRKIRRLFFDRRGVNVVISNVLMVCAVMSLGFVVFYWTQQRAFEANEEYADATEENIARIREKLVYENMFYNSSENTLTVYLINCGKSDDASFASVYLSNSSWYQSFSDIELRFLNGTLVQSLDIDEEGYFKLSVSLVAFYTSYLSRITTGRGRLFATTFTA